MLYNIIYTKEALVGLYKVGKHCKILIYLWQIINEKKLKDKKGYKNSGVVRTIFAIDCDLVNGSY